jgi:hypothetical protein
MGVSRKSFIGAALGVSDPAERLSGTLALSVYGAEHGIEVARVHDVRPNLDAVRMWEILHGAEADSTAGADSAAGTGYPEVIVPETEEEAIDEAEEGRR